jgi:hypothetical protein
MSWNKHLTNFVLTVNGSHFYNFQVDDRTEFFVIFLSNTYHAYNRVLEYNTVLVTDSFYASVDFPDGNYYYFFIEAWSANLPQQVSEVFQLNLCWPEIMDITLMRTAVLTNYINSNALQTVLSLVIPAYYIEEFDLIDLVLFAEVLQNSGSSNTLTRDLWLNGAQKTSNANSFANSAIVSKVFLGSKLLRLDNNLYISSSYPGKTGTGYNEHASQTIYNQSSSGDPFSGSIGNVLTAPNFGSNITLEFKVQFANANALSYFKPRCCWIYKYRSSN